MKFSIKHEMTGRMRVHLSQNRMTYAQADILLYFYKTISTLHVQKYMSGPEMR